ncbi:FUSC family protein [Pseudomonas sp. SA3-5]|uniref:FUSC family protein n=1 Tax=Pseudomonas aestuarii TaxID=3018340 RepID=A0ABT4XBH6_9PSED|nr:FUSC family protein [Pseudomonas aestuarii]MDA7085542.1 FUSC family protein [Pseudomonas aestuarii]
MNKWITQLCRRLIGRLRTGAWLQWPSRSALTFSLHTTSAALLALVIAQALELHHPWWAAMTVWLVAQPTRGLLIERIGARLIGTVVGALAGGLLLTVLFDQHVWLMLALAGWIAVCAGVGHQFRHFRNYGFVLAGYTAAIVALFGVLDPVLDVGLALGRIYCTVIGVLASACFSWAFTGKSASPESFHNRLQALVVASVCYSLKRLEVGTNHDAKSLSALLQEIASLDLYLDEIVAGSRTMRLRVRRTRDALGAIVDLLVSSHFDVGGTLRFSSDLPIGIQAKSAAATVQAVSNEVHKHAENLPVGMLFVEKLQGVFAAFNACETPLSEALQLIKQRDWRATCLAASRPLIAMCIATAVWWGLDWSDGPMMVMTAVLFASLFSSHSHANAALKGVLIGSSAGAVLGVICRFWLLPEVGTVWGLALVIAPFLIIGALLMARPGTAKLAIDLNMTFLLIAQPGLHVDTSFEHTLLQMLAILGGVFTAVLTYRWLVPSSPGSQRKRLYKRIAQLTLRMLDAPASPAQARIYDQVRDLLTRLISLEKKASPLLIAAFERAAIAQLFAYHRTDEHHSRALHQHLATLATTKLENKTKTGADLL